VQSHYPENGAREEAKGRQGKKCRTWTPSKKQRKMNIWRNYNSHEIDVAKEFDADFNFPKIHMISHWVERIRRYGSFQQTCVQSHDEAHNTNLKNGWNSTNHNLNFLRHLTTFQHRILCIDIRELNLQVLSQCRENSAATCKALPSVADLAAPLSSQLNAKPKFM
jgi:hypothetical protein